MQTYMVGINLVKIRHLHSIAKLSLPCIAYTTHGNVETMEADSSSSQRLKTDYITKTVNMSPYSEAGGSMPSRDLHHHEISKIDCYGM